MIGFLDDDPVKYKNCFLGFPVLGSGCEAAPLTAHARGRGTPVTEIVIAMPAATGRQMETAIANCRATGVTFRLCRA